MQNRGVVDPVETFFDIELDDSFIDSFCLGAEIQE